MIKTKKMKHDAFYQACLDACDKLGKKHNLGTYSYNILKEYGLIDRILSGTINLDDYTDNDLKSFRGLGNISVDILRIAWRLYSKEPMQQMLGLDPATIRGYSIGKDLIRWIIEHKLENKKIYFAGHNCIGFIKETHVYEGMPYNTTCDLNVLNGDYLEIQDNVS